jgi:hypothetical protein
LFKKELPHDAECQSLLELFSNDCFIENNIIWGCIKRQFKPSQVVIFYQLPLFLTFLVRIMVASLPVTMASTRERNDFYSVTTGLTLMLTVIDAHHLTCGLY